MNKKRDERVPRRLCAWVLGLAAPLLPIGCGKPLPQSGASHDAVGDLEVGRRGGRLVAALEAEPQTLNPVLVSDLFTRAAVHRMTADLIHIDRVSQRTVPALAESWTVSDDGRRYTLRLRPELRFSDGHPMDADDVVFSFMVYLDEQIGSPSRDLLLVGGQAPVVRKLDSLTVEFELSEPYAAGERLFDGFAVLPRHRLQDAYTDGRFAEAWGLGTPAEAIAGLGPFRLQEYRPGERLVLARNPYYWRRDAAGQPLPYLDEIVFLFTSKEAQTLRLLAGELDLVDRLAPEDFALLSRQEERRGLRLRDLGAGLDVFLLFFNLNDLSDKDLPSTARKQQWFRQLAFRRAVLAAIDLEGIVRLAFQGRATALASHVTPGNKGWLNRALKPPRRSLSRARRHLEAIDFHWDRAGRLVDAEGQAVGFSLLTVASSPQAAATATLIQDDLRQLGIEVRVAALELGAAAERLFETHDYEACLIGLGGGSGGPNPAMNLLLSSGSHHFWRLGREPATPWQTEIDRLMRQQRSTLLPEERKRQYDRVQELVADNLPFLSLVSPNVLVGAKARLGNFRPAQLPHHTLANAEVLFWK